ncbi:MAG: hypothetical protein AAB834_07745, partial [Patescibacteria group bacterium]
MRVPNRNFNVELCAFDEKSLKTLQEAGLISSGLGLASLAILRCVLCRVRGNEPIYTGEISRCTGIPATNVFPRLRILEGSGFVCRDKEPGDAAELGRPLKNLYYSADSPAGETLVNAAEA